MCFQSKFKYHKDKWKDGGKVIEKKKKTFF